MRIIDLDAKRGILELQIDDVYDFYALWLFIRPGDEIEAITTRKVKFSSGESDRVKMRLIIRVEKLSFHDMTDTLRIKGVIVEGPDKFVSLGSHHTLTLKIGTKLKIFRSGGFNDADLKLLEEASSLSKISPLILIAIERDESTIAILTGKTLRIVDTIYQNVSYKDSPNPKALLHMFFKRILDTIKELLNEYPVGGIIIAGPGTIKERFMEYLKRELDKQIEFPIILDQVSSGTVAGIHEILRRGTALRIAKEQKISQAYLDYEKFLEHLGKNDGYAVYGLEDVERAIEWGAAKVAYISTNLLKMANPDTYRRVINLVKRAMEIGVKLELVSPGHPLYDVLDNFGGAFALLKFRIRY